MYEKPREHRGAITEELRVAHYGKDWSVAGHGLNRKEHRPGLRPPSRATPA